MIRYKITLKQQILVLGLTIITTVAVSLLFLLFTNAKTFWMNIAFTSFIFLFDVLPAIILHVQYWRTNRKAELIINKVDGSISYRNFSHTINFSVDDIRHLQYFVSYGKQTGVYSFAIYRYYKIVLKDKSQIIITCLMINDIENTLEMLLKLKAEKKLKFYCFLPLRLGVVS